MSDWRTRALCKDEDLEMFFPSGSSMQYVAQVIAAKAVCDKCPVKVECRDAAFQFDNEYGVWAGLSEEERKIMRKGQKRRSYPSPVRRRKR